MVRCPTLRNLVYVQLLVDTLAIALGLAVLGPVGLLFGYFFLMTIVPATMVSATCSLAITMQAAVSYGLLVAFMPTAALREASDALGATRRQTVLRVVLPAAAPGILTGTILALGRAAGETAPILFTGVAFYLPTLPRSPYDQVMALPYHLYVLATQVPNPPPPLPYATALALLGVVRSSSAVAIGVRLRLRRRELT